MSKPTRRQLTVVENQWRLPEDEPHINKYPLPLASALAAGVATLVGLMLSFIVVMAIWLFAAHGNESTIQVVRASAIAWQATHYVTVSIGSIPLGLLPWGFAVIPAIIIWKTTQWALKSAQPNTATQFWSIGILFSLFYGGLSGLISLVTSTEGLSTSFFDAFSYSSLIALIVSIAVVVTYAPSPTILIDKLPKEIVAGLKPGFVVFLIFWIFSSVTTALVLIFRWNEIRTVSGLMAPSSIDQIFLTLLSIGYIPTLISWTLTFLLGANIYLGGAALVNTSVVTPGALPAFPILSVLPSEVIPWAKYLIAIPILVGIFIYFLIPREPWKAQGDSLPIALSHTVRWREFVRIIVSLTVFAIATWLVTNFSSGTLGQAYLAYIGPKPNEVVIQLIKISGISALVTLLAPRVILSLIHWWINRPKPQKNNP